jgi:hypothetical protein
MRNSINFEDLFDWQLESDRHYMFLLERHKQEEYEWQQWEEQERNKRLPALIQIELIPTLHETKSKPLALRGTNQEII